MLIFENKLISIFRKFEVNFSLKKISKIRIIKKIRTTPIPVHLRIQNTIEILKSTKYIINRFVKTYKKLQLIF